MTLFSPYSIYPSLPHSITFCTSHLSSQLYLILPCFLLHVLQRSQNVKAELVPPETCSSSQKALQTTQFPGSKASAGISSWNLCQRTNIKDDNNNNNKQQDYIAHLHTPLHFSNFGLHNYPNMKNFSFFIYTRQSFLFLHFKKANSPISYMHIGFNESK